MTVITGIISTSEITVTTKTTTTNMTKNTKIIKTIIKTTEIIKTVITERKTLRIKTITRSIKIESTERRNMLGKKNMARNAKKKNITSMRRKKIMAGKKIERKTTGITKTTVGIERVKRNMTKTTVIKIIKRETEITKTIEKKIIKKKTIKITIKIIASMKGNIGNTKKRNQVHLPIKIPMQQQQSLRLHLQ